jgi:hypothetical protein
VTLPGLAELLAAEADADASTTRDYARLTVRELDLLRRLDGPPPLEDVTISRAVLGLAIRAVAEIKSTRNIVRRLHETSERAPDVRAVPMRLVHRDVFDELLAICPTKEI